MPQLNKFLSLDDFEAAARRLLPRPIFGYVEGATENNLSLRDNRAVFEEILFRPRVLVDVSGREQSVELFGTRYASPFGIAPMGICALTGYRGDLAQALAAKKAGIPMVLSSSALIPMEEVAAAAPGTWFQLYVPRHEAAALREKKNAGVPGSHNVRVPTYAVRVRITSQILGRHGVCHE